MAISRVSTEYVLELEKGLEVAKSAYSDLLQNSFKEVKNLHALLGDVVTFLDGSHLQDCAFEDDSENETACDCGIDELLTRMREELK